MLAFTLQLAVPAFDLGGIAALAGEAALRADLQSSLCHDGSSGAAPDQSPAAPPQVKHCIFCLPMAGNPATAVFILQAPVPTVAAAIVPFAADDQVPSVSRPAFARARAPPSSPRTV
ncbi:hypothetical protein H261_09337 [Paramagnetospirillum caucaseum]|uniref:DUF2946 domain-containing protein n=1 Tax=Paramagnetospirillum caucaseum TaxID=1244869 RepID=M2YB55_9PROT|nr:hypothetical protein H261_09337 [Paramagnetospirillum caucaseum]